MFSNYSSPPFEYGRAASIGNGEWSVLREMRKVTSKKKVDRRENFLNSRGMDDEVK